MWISEYTYFLTDRMTLSVAPLPDAKKPTSPYFLYLPMTGRQSVPHRL